MKKVFIFLLFIIASGVNADRLNNIPQKVKDNPILAHYLSLDEILLNRNYNRDFTPTDPPTGVIRQTSEFEQMEGVLVVYPLGVPYELIAEMSEDTFVYTVVPSYLQSQCESNYQSNNVNMENCEFINSPTNTYWIRDYGPWFISVDNEIAVVNFPYNRPRPDDDDIPIEVANYLNLDLYGMDLVSTGGNYMCDGNDIGASTDLVYDENTNMTSTEIDQLVLDYLGIEEYHVTIDPLDDYIKHIDCWGKFIDVDEVLIGEVPESDYRYEDFEFVADYFATQTSAWGNDYEVHRIYTPGSSYQATPYTNSLILNKKVFVPQTGSEWDDEALATYEDIMPGYEIIGVYSSGWIDTDALHCRTRGIADRNMLYIQHDPILNELPYGEEIEISTEIIAYSGEPLYLDSLKVYYKIDEGDYNSITLQPDGQDQYSALLPSIDPESEVSYFIHAADESGHSMNHPYIGSFDPHVFTVAENPDPPELVVDPTSFNLEMNVDELQLETLALSNIGGSDLEFTTYLEDPVTWLGYDLQSWTILPGESIETNLEFDTNDLEPNVYSTNIIISDNREITEIPVTLTVSQTNSNDNMFSDKTELIGNFPNPFSLSGNIRSSQTVIKYNLSKAAQVSLMIYNVKGQLIKTLVDVSQIAGTYNIMWNGKDAHNKKVTSGIYFSKFDVYENGVNDYTSVKKIIVLK